MRAKGIGMTSENVSCTGCGRSYTDQQFLLGLVYCPGCGQKLIRAEPQRSPAFCPYCGQANRVADADFCAYCGKKWSGPPSIQPTSDFSDVTSDSNKPPPIVPGEYAQECAEEPMDFSGYGVGYAPYYRSKPALPEKALSWLKSIARRCASIVGDYVSGRYRVKKLYQYWTSYSDLPPESLPSRETIEQLARESGADSTRPLRISMVVLAFAGIIIVFVGVGLLIRSC